MTCMRGEETPKGSTSSIELNQPLTSDKRSDIRAEPKYGVEMDQFLKDGRRKIDYIIAYRKRRLEREDDEDETKRGRKRTEFFENLRAEGLVLEEAEPDTVQADPNAVAIEVGGDTQNEQEEEDTIFVKVHAPWEVLARYAEIMKIKMPIRENDIEEPRSFWHVLRKIPNPFALREDFVKKEPNYFTLPFMRSREKEFMNIDNKDKFFNNATRSRIVHDILEKTRYDPDDKTKFGHEHMIANGSFIACFPLHDGEWQSEESLLTHGPLNDRHLLFEEWARPKNFYKEQPLNLIRRYYGEKIGIYFTWLGYYTVMLTYAAIFGLVTFLFGCITLNSSVKVDEICNEEGPGGFIMCPLCDERCDYWYLYSSCLTSKLTYLFDNWATVIFAIFMSLWATMFCEFWKRKENTLQYEWDLFGFEEIEENTRPEFEAEAPSKRISPVTQEEEPYVPKSQRMRRVMVSVTFTLLMIMLVIAAVLSIIVYRIAVRVALASTGNEFATSSASIVTSVTASCISVAVIMILQRFYERIAAWLTDMELHRTDTEYEDSLVFKMYLFAFVNYYTTNFYIAFIKGKIPGNPSDYGKIFGLRQEECDASGCMQELFINIAIIMCGKQFYNNFLELGTPIIMNRLRSYRERKEEKKGKGKYERWEKDIDLVDIGPRGLFREYLEMVIQFGFTTILVCAFPLAPLFALLNNLIEIRLDAFKFISQFRRPYAARAQDIGAWYSILLGVGNISILTNALVLAFTSEFIPQIVYKHQEGEGTLAGYMDFSLSKFNPVDFEPGSAPKDSVFVNVTECRYRGYYDSTPPYEYSYDNWLILFWKLFFVLMYEHVIFMIKQLLAYVIPDVPDFVQNQIRRERYLAQQALHEATLILAKQDEAAEQGDMEAKGGPAGQKGAIGGYKDSHA